MKHSILIVDDEAAVRQLLSQLVIAQGWQPDQAESATAALTRLHQATFDLVLCDLDLREDRSGLDVLSEMPALNQHTPFVVLTGHGSIGRCREAFLMGAADFLEKPFLPTELMRALARAVAHHDAPRRAAGAADVDAPEEAVDSPAAARHVRTALAHIERSFSKHDFSIATLADHVGVTQAHLSRLFTARLGRGPLAQLHHHRIRVAEALLRDDALSVFAIATDVGYASVSEFDARFRKLHGCTPSQWRTQVRGEKSKTPY